MTSHFHSASGDLSLARWPLEQPNRSLQAWDAADELLLQQAVVTIAELELALQRPVKLLILNDSFGALSCALSAWPQVWVTDSYLSELGCRYNRQQNASSSISTATLSSQSSLTPLPADADLVLLRHDDLTIDQVFAMGKQLVAAGQPLVKGTFEP